MIRTILKSDKNRLTLELPDDMVGKMIEIIAFSVDETNIVDNNTSKESSVEALKNKLKDFTFNSGGYKFDREDANNYE